MRFFLSGSTVVLLDEPFCSWVCRRSRVNPVREFRQQQEIVTAEADEFATAAFGL